MHKWFIPGLGVLLSSCLFAAAQTPGTRVVPNREPAPPLILARVAPAQLPPVFVLAAQPAGRKLVGLTALLVRAEGSEQGLKRLFSVGVVKTMFATESRVPIVRVLGGRLQLDGFSSAYRMENLQLGPSGLGHPGMTTPRSAWAYGISLRFRLGRDAPAERQAGGWRHLAWMVGAGGDGGVQKRTPQLAASPNE